MRLKLASRRSDLARIQCQAVGEALRKADPTIEIEYIFRESLGDKNLDQPLWKMPEKGVFTEDFVMSLREGEIDAVVHSWKDLPTDLPADLPIVGVLERADARDLLLIKKSSLKRIEQLKRVKIYSSSPRREFCLGLSLPELWPGGLEKVETIAVRGNIATRIKKLFASEEIDGLMIAKAALDRLMQAPPHEYGAAQTEMAAMLAQTIWMCLPLSQFPTAPAQGALALQYLNSRKDLAEVFSAIRNRNMERQVTIERRRLAEQGGGCHQKLGCSVVSVPQGDMEFFRCELPNGEQLLRRALLQAKTTVPAQMWSSEEWKSHRDWEPLPWQVPPVDVILVSKAEALPKEAHLSETQIVWAAGVETWRRLAARGIWVSGCADRMGLVVPQLPFWFKKSPSWRRLTHQDAVLSNEDLATYKIFWKTEPPVPENYDFYFFGSAFEAKEFLKRVRPKAGDQWFCGVGRSFDEIQKICPAGVNLTAVWSKD